MRETPSARSRGARSLLEVLHVASIVVLVVRAARSGRPGRRRPGQQRFGPRPEAWVEGSLRESARTADVLLGLVLVQAGLVIWWLVFRDDAPASSGRTLLHLLGYLAICTAVLLVLQVERAAERFQHRTGGRTWRLTVTAWAAAVALIGTTGAWAWYLCSDAELPRTVAQVAVLLVAVPALGSYALHSTRRWAARRDQSARAASAAGTAVTVASTPCEVTLAFSGGGIRAATFALGAWNALSAPDRLSKSMTGPRIVAVSGGSYLAAAIMLARRYAVSGPEGKRTARRRPLGDVPWTDAYAVTSPEAARLRRHSRDLVEPRSQLLGGALTLVAGSVLNLVVLLGFLWFSAWTLSWLHSTAALLERSGGELVLSLPFAFDRHGIAVWGPPIVAASALALLAIGLICAARKADDTGEVPRYQAWFARLRSLALVVAAGYLLVVAGVPSLVHGLSRLAVTNTPTPTVAAVLENLGFADQELCRTGARAGVQAALDAAQARARLNLGQPQRVEAGACGATYAVTVTRDQDGGAAADTDVSQLVEDLLEATEPVPGVAGTAGTTALLTLVSTLALAVRRANAAADPKALAGWRGRLRKVFLAWLPSGVLALTLSWLLLSWTFALTVADAEPSHPWVALAILLPGLLGAVFIDANATALHSYYRHRLSSAYAVARDDAGGTADNLPFDQSYGFSDLGRLPLQVVTTANVRAYDEAPSRRGGLPMVFSPECVRLVTKSGETVVPTREFEAAAGRGRVSVMAVVATSGAAVSPMAGRFSYGLAPFRVLLTLFNVRVGTWVLNPLWGSRLGGSTPERRWRSDWPWRPWLIARPGSAQVLAEAVGRSSTGDRWLYLSDGGHLDNTGLVEAVRLHRTASGYSGLVVVVDASNDAAGTWSAVGDAVGVVRAELGIDLRCVHGDVAAPASEESTQDARRDETQLARLLNRLLTRPAEEEARPYVRIYEHRDGEALLEVMVVKAVRPGASAELPEPVRAFAARTPEFPRASTSRQDFGDIEFEAYRALGEHYTSAALDARDAHRLASGCR